jgi:hypothetical protein
MLKIISVKCKIVPALNFIKTYGVVEEWLHPFFDAPLYVYVTGQWTGHLDAVH